VRRSRWAPGSHADRECDNARVREPTYDDIATLPAHAQQSVPAAFEDLNGHLNIRHYLGITSEGLDEALEEIGVRGDWRNTGRAVFSAEHHLTYFHELRTGDRVSTRVRLVGRSERAVHALAYLVDEERKRVSYVMEEIFLCIDMETRRTTPWDDDVAAQIDARVKEHQDLPWQAELSGSMALR
jgi:acyl-CoA thioester hydrolase